MVVCPPGFHPGIDINWKPQWFESPYPPIICVPDVPVAPPEAVKPGKNPKGGGGDQWEPMRIERQGEFGVKRTFAGKIVYKRPRHYWSESDLRRVTRSVIDSKSRLEAPETWEWWDFLLDTTLHIVRGVGALAGIVYSPSYSNLLEILEWLKDNKGWQEQWQPRIEEAWRKFWEVLTYGKTEN